MRHAFLRTLQTPSVELAQQRAFGRVRPLAAATDTIQALGQEEASFIAARDSFYLASVGEGGWPYVQHRGGPRGFLRVLGPARLAFADYSGNRQLITAGNVAAAGRVALFLMDYPARERLKIIGLATVHEPAAVPELVGALAVPAGAKIERVFTIEVVGFDWNCSQYITPRFTAEDVEEATQPLRDRIAELEAQLTSGR